MFWGRHVDSETIVRQFILSPIAAKYPKFMATVGKLEITITSTELPQVNEFRKNNKPSLTKTLGKVQASPLSPPLRTGHESFQLIRLKPYFKLEDLDLRCTCL
jgi:hypothetical protein